MPLDTTNDLQRVVSTPQIESIDFVQVSPELTLKTIFHGGDGSDLIAIGSLRHGKKQPEPYLHAEHPFPSNQVGMGLSILASPPSLTRYIQFVGFDWRACPITRQGKTLSHKGGTVWIETKNQYVNKVYAVGIDLDVGRPGTISTAQGLQIVTEMILSGNLPHPTLLAKSGRGIYLVYVLRDENGAPYPNSPEVQSRRLYVIDELLHRLRNVCPDRSASRSLARWFKAPSSGQYMQAATHSEVWSLERLENALSAYADSLAQSAPEPTSANADAPDLRYHKPNPVTKPSKKVGGKRGGNKAAPSRKRKDELKKLAHFRGMGEGSGRRQLLFYFAAAVRNEEMCRTNDPVQAQRVAIQEALALNETFDSPLSRSEVLDRTQSNGRIHHTNDRVGDDLRVTDEEINALALTSTLPRTHTLRKKEEKSTRELRRKNRQALIDDLLASGLGNKYISTLTGVPPSTIATRKTQLVRAHSDGRRPALHQPRKRIFIMYN